MVCGSCRMGIEDTSEQKIFSIEIHHKSHTRCPFCFMSTKVYDSKHLTPQHLFANSPHSPLPALDRDWPEMPFEPFTKGGPIAPLALCGRTAESVLRVPSVFRGTFMELLWDGGKGSGRFLVVVFNFAATWREREWRHWNSRISGFSSVVSEFCYISDSVAISTLNCCTFY